MRWLALPFVAVFAILGFKVCSLPADPRHCRWKHSEAKTNLLQIYTAEKSYFGTHGRYAGDLAELGWAADGTPMYLFGFPGSASAATPKTKTLHGRALTTSDLRLAFVNDTAFRAVAVADIDSDPVEDLDVWTVDQNRTLTNVWNDCLHESTNPSRSR